MLQLPAGRQTSTLLSHPTLLLLKPDTVTAHWRQLRQLLQDLASGLPPDSLSADRSIAHAAHPTNGASAEPARAGSQPESGTAAADGNADGAGSTAAASAADKLLRRLVARQPSLLYQSPEALRGRAAALCARLSLPPAALAAALAEIPALLILDPDTLSHKLDVLSEQLGLERGAAVALVGKHPVLLALAPSALPARVDALMELLGGVDRAAVQSWLCRRPELLLSSAHTLSAKLSALQRFTQLPRGEIVASALAQPALLLLDSAALEAKWRLVQQFVAGSARLAADVAAVGSNASAVARLLQCSEAILHRLQAAAALDAEDLERRLLAGQKRKGNLVMALLRLTPTQYEATLGSGSAAAAAGAAGTAVDAPAADAKWQLARHYARGSARLLADLQAARAHAGADSKMQDRSDAVLRRLEVAAAMPLPELERRLGIRYAKCNLATRLLRLPFAQFEAAFGNSAREATQRSDATDVTAAAGGVDVPLAEAKLLLAQRCANSSARLTADLAALCKNPAQLARLNRRSEAVLRRLEAAAALPLEELERRLRCLKGSNLVFKLLKMPAAQYDAVFGSAQARASEADQQAAFVHEY